MQSRQRLIQDQKNKEDNNQIRKIRVDLGKRSFLEFSTIPMYRTELTKYNAQ